MKTVFYITRIHGIMVVQTESTEFLSYIIRLFYPVQQEIAVHFVKKNFTPLQYLITQGYRNCDNKKWIKTDTQKNKAGK